MLGRALELLYPVPPGGRAGACQRLISYTIIPHAPFPAHSCGMQNLLHPVPARYQSLAQSAKLHVIYCIAVKECCSLHLQPLCVCVCVCV